MNETGKMYVTGMDLTGPGFEFGSQRTIASEYQADFRAQFRRELSISIEQIQHSFRVRQAANVEEVSLWKREARPHVLADARGGRNLGRKKRGIDGVPRQENLRRGDAKIEEVFTRRDSRDNKRVAIADEFAL